MDTCTVNPLLIPLGGLFISNLLEGGLIETGGLFGRSGGGGGLFTLEKTMVSVVHKELEHKAEKLKNKMVGVHAAENQNQIQISSW